MQVWRSRLADRRELTAKRARSRGHASAGTWLLLLRGIAAIVLDVLNRELGVKRLLLEGGGGANEAFLRAGLISHDPGRQPGVGGRRDVAALPESRTQEIGLRRVGEVSEMRQEK